MPFSSVIFTIHFGVLYTPPLAKTLYAEVNSVNFAPFSVFPSATLKFLSFSLMGISVYLVKFSDFSIPVPFKIFTAQEFKLFDKESCTLTSP